MVSPQCEDGYLKIAMQLVEKFTSSRISGQEWQIIWTVWRKTWGWKKKYDVIALSQFTRATGIDRRKCHILVQNLVIKNILNRRVTQKGDRRIIKYGFNKDFEKWKLTPKKVTPFTNIDDIKENIRKRDSNICKLCGYDGNLTKERLPIHHIDFDEGNNDDNNLITLCKSCHGRSHTHKNKWKEKLLSLVTQKGDKADTQKGDSVTPKRVTRLTPKRVSTIDSLKAIFKDKSTEPFQLPDQQEISESAIPKIKADLKEICEHLYENKIFIEVHAFKNKMLKEKKSERAILHTLVRCALKKKFETTPWAYCIKIMGVEDGNYNEYEFRKDKG